MPISYKNQRVGVFVDVSNLYYSAKHLFKQKVNYKSVLETAATGRKLIRAMAYVVVGDSIKKEQNFADALGKIGYEVRSKELLVYWGGDKKGDWDIGIAMDTIEMAPKLDVVVLVSGDGDYIPLVEHLKRAQSCKVEVMAFKKSASSKLLESADKFTDLGASKKYLMT